LPVELDSQCHSVGQANREPGGFSQPSPEQSTSLRDKCTRPSSVLRVSVAKSLHQVLLFIIDEDRRTQNHEERRPEDEEERIDEQGDSDEQGHFTQRFRMPIMLVYPSKHLGSLRRLHGFFARILHSLHQDRRGWNSNSERNDFCRNRIRMESPSEVRHRKPDPENHVDDHEKVVEACNAP